MEKAKTGLGMVSRTRSIVFVGLTIAIITVSAWVTVPLGPVPFTLQMFALTFAIVVLTPRQCMAAVAGYVLLGAVGLPVFSGMRGGIGVLAGPTGGFLWGYLFGAVAAILLLGALRTRMTAKKDVSRDGTDVGANVNVNVGMGGNVAAFLRSAGAELVAGLLFTAVSYLCGWVQFMAVAGVGPKIAFFMAIAPFIAVDVLKIVAAVACARTVRAAVR